MTSNGVRRGVTLVEGLIGLALISVLLGVTFGLLGQGMKSSRKISAILGLQADSQRAVLRFLRELQESIEVILPQPGHTLPYAMVRDKLNQVKVISVVRDGERRTLRVETVAPSGTEVRAVLSGVRTLRFSCLSAGSLRVHLALETDGTEQALFTQVRLRNQDAPRDGGPL